MKTHVIIKAAKTAGITAKRGYRFVTTGKIKRDDYVRHKSIPWEPANGLIGVPVAVSYDNSFVHDWFAVRKIVKCKPTTKPRK